MKKIYQIISITLALVILASCSGSKEELSVHEKIKEEKKITVAVSPDYVPYEFLDLSKKGQEQFVGADIELARYIAKNLDAELEIKAMDFGDIPSAIARKRFDIGISGFTYSEDRAKQVDFSKSYDNSESTCQGFLIRKADEKQYQSLEDFENKNIAVQNGSLQQAYLEKQFPNNKERLAKKLDDAVLELKYEKIDAVAISCESAKSFMLNNDDLILSDVKMEASDEEGMMVIMPKGEQSLVDEINRIIDEITEQKLYEKWIQEANQLAEEIGAVNE